MISCMGFSPAMDEDSDELDANKTYSVIASKLPWAAEAVPRTKKNERMVDR